MVLSPLMGYMFENGGFLGIEYVYCELCGPDIVVW